MTTITAWQDRPMPLPTDFIFTRTFIEKLRIIKMEEGIAIVGINPLSHVEYTTAAYFIFLMTQFGDMRIEVSKIVFDLLTTDDSVVVSYQRGRWTGALKGRIAR